MWNIKRNSGTTYKENMGNELAASYQIRSIAKYFRTFNTK